MVCLHGVCALHARTQRDAYIVDLGFIPVCSTYSMYDFAWVSLSFSSSCVNRPMHADPSFKTQIFVTEYQGINKAPECF